MAYDLLDYFIMNRRRIDEIMKGLGNIFHSKILKFFIVYRGKNNVLYRFILHCSEDLS